MQLQSGKSMLLEAAVLIYKLEDKRLYSPWQVAASGYDRNSQRQDYDRIRLNLGEWSRYHNIRETFENCDEHGKRLGRFPAWYGSTWKEHLGHKDMEAAKTWITKECQPRQLQVSKADVEQPTVAPAQTGEDAGRSGRKWVRWALALPIAAAVTLFLYLPRTQSAPTPLTPVAEIKAKTAPSQPASSLSIMEFTAARKQARLERKPIRARQFMHPPISDLTWEMTLIDEPMLDQAAIMPNCVFLVSRTPKDMMPFIE